MVTSFPLQMPLLAKSVFVHALLENGNSQLSAYIRKTSQTFDGRVIFCQLRSLPKKLENNEQKC
jgi:hypothetical protein